jgi:cell wall-associated NlpC family hydrolase
MTLPFKALRRMVGVALAAVLVLALAAPASAADSTKPEPGASGFELLGRAVLTAIESSQAGDAFDSLQNSLALIGARYRVEAIAEEAYGEAPSAPVPDEPVDDPSELPPASAGSNGSHTPRASSLRDEPLFARSRTPDSSTAILLSGIALPPPDAPEAVKGAINAANTIVGRPYVWGGGHQSWYSAGYDCSGAVSFALFGGGLIPRPLTSGDLMRWGAPGPGQWITVYAHPGHTYVEIAGLRWDTVGDENGTGPRWHLAKSAPDGFAVRHPPGL